MRALFFVDVPHRLGGAQRSLLASVQGLRGHGIEPHVVFPGPGLCVDAYRAAGLRTTILPGPESLLVFGKKLLEAGAISRGLLLMREVLPYAKRLGELVEREGVDVLHFNTPRGILAAGWTARLTGRPSILHLRGQVPFGGILWTVAQALADRIVLVARAVEKAVSVPFRDRTRVVYNGVPLVAHPDRAGGRQRLSRRLARPLEDDEVVFASLSSLVPFKGLHHIITAAATARARGLRARYVLAGDGHDKVYERWLHERRRELGLEELVDFIGYVDQPTALLTGADALILSSVGRERFVLGGKEIELDKNEGLPRSTLEAMSVGLPVISSDTGGAVEQIEQGKTGWIIAPGDPEALADKLVQVGGDRLWRERAGERAREIIAARFTLEQTAKGLADVMFDLAPAALPQPWPGLAAPPR